MSEQVKKGLVPELRFPEFLDSGAWEEKKLGGLSKILRGGSPRPIDEYITSDIDGLNWLKIADVDKDSKYVTITKERVLVTALSKTRQVNPGDLIMSNSMSFGRPHILKITTCIHDGWIAVTEINDQASRDYLYYLILSPTSQKFFIDNAAGSGVQNLNADIIKVLPVLIPEYTEQQKIASCLSSIDTLITTHTQKHEVLRVHKNGVMQQLFPIESEIVPKLRFPEFVVTGEWKDQKLEGLAKRGSGHTPNKSKPSYYNGEVKWISLADSKKLDNGYIYETKNKISEEGIKNSSAVLHPAGTVVISRDAGVGKSAVLYTSMAVSQHFIVWQCDETKLSNWFLYYVLQILKPKLEEIAVGSTIKTIGLPYFKEMRVTIPSIAEQQKIADCLISVDDLITIQAQKIEALKAHKKGLMQQLFPATDEVNA